MSRELERELTAAKQDFSQQLLANDAFFALVRNRLQSDNGMLPTFACEPFIQTSDRDNPYHNGTAGVVLAYSGAWQNKELSEVSVGFSMFNHVSIMEVTDNVGKPAKGIVSELKEAEIADPKEAWIALASEWQTGFNGIIRRLGGEVGLSPLDNTLQLLDTIHNTYVFPTDPQN